MTFILTVIKVKSSKVEFTCMTIQEIYTKYKIMPSLQLHMLRVAGVASVICEHFGGEVERENVVRTCLLHDMGNIIKFNLNFRPGDLEPEGFEYWNGVKDEFMRKYGNDETMATHKIVEELGVGSRVLEILGFTGFAMAEKCLSTDDFTAKIVEYSDERVAPNGVVAMLDRLYEGRSRFLANKNYQSSPEVFDKLVATLKLLEKEIFEKCDIGPNEITNEVVNAYIENLRKFVVV